MIEEEKIALKVASIRAAATLIAQCASARTLLPAKP